MSWRSTTFLPTEAPPVVGSHRRLCSLYLLFSFRHAVARPQIILRSVDDVSHEIPSDSSCFSYQVDSLPDQQSHYIGLGVLLSEILSLSRLRFSISIGLYIILGFSLDLYIFFIIDGI